MTEKYIVKKSSNFTNVFFVGNIQLQCSKEKAELVCRLLNEDEKRKSAPKLTRDEIDLAINDAQDNLNYYNGRKTKDEDIPRYENIIKFLESLECNDE